MKNNILIIGFGDLAMRLESFLLEKDNSILGLTRSPEKYEGSNVLYWDWNLKTEFELSDNCDNIPTNNFFLSASRCVVGSSSIIKFRFDEPNKLAIPNLKANAMLTDSPPLSDFISKTSVFE